MDLLFEGCPAVARALKRLSDEHGRPNTFSASEVFQAGGPPPRIVGRIGSSMTYRFEVFALLGGREKWGSPPAYSNGRWAV